jgi:hypothetical protein
LQQSTINQKNEIDETTATTEKIKALSAKAEPSCRCCKTKKTEGRAAKTTGDPRP